MICHLKFEIKNISMIDELMGNYLHEFKKVQGVLRQEGKGYQVRYNHTEMKQVSITAHYDKNNVAVYLWLTINPHYHHNRYRHNGNDLSVLDCKKAIKESLGYFGISVDKWADLRVVNIEFGVNIVPKQEVEKILDQCRAWGGKAFVRDDADSTRKGYMLRAGNKTTIQIKLYHKGWQKGHFADVDDNTMRFEVKTNRGIKIKSLGINTALDLRHDETYEILGKEIEKQFRQIVMYDEKQSTKGIKPKDKSFLISCLSLEAWAGVRKDKGISTSSQRIKFYKVLGNKYTLKSDLTYDVGEKILELKTGEKQCKKQQSTKPSSAIIKKQTKISFKATINPVNKGGCSALVMSENTKYKPPRKTPLSYM